MEIKVSERRQTYLDQLELNSVYDIIDYIPKRYTDLSAERLDITKHNKKATINSMLNLFIYNHFSLLLHFYSIF